MKKTKNSPKALVLVLAAAALASCGESKSETTSVSVTDFGFGTSPESQVTQYEAGNAIDFWFKTKKTSDVHPTAVSINDSLTKFSIEPIRTDCYKVASEGSFLMPNWENGANYVLSSLFYTLDGSASEFKAKVGISAKASLKNGTAKEDGIALASFASPLNGNENVPYATNDVPATLNLTFGKTVDASKAIVITIKKEDADGASETENITLTPSNGVYPSSVSIKRLTSCLTEQTYSLTSATYVSTLNGKTFTNQFVSGNTISFKMNQPPYGINYIKRAQSSNFFFDNAGVATAQVGSDFQLTVGYGDSMPNPLSSYDEVKVKATVSDSDGNEKEVESEAMSAAAGTIMATGGVREYILKPIFKGTAFENKDYKVTKASVVGKKNGANEEISSRDGVSVPFAFYDLVITNASSLSDGNETFYSVKGLSSLAAGKRAILKENITESRGMTSLASVEILNCTLNGNGKTISDGSEASRFPFFMKVASTGTIKNVNFDLNRKIEKAEYDGKDIVAASGIVNVNEGLISNVGANGKICFGSVETLSTGKYEIQGLIGTNSGTVQDFQNCVKFSTAYSGSGSMSNTLYCFIKTNSGAVKDIVLYSSSITLANSTTCVHLCIGENSGSLSNAVDAFKIVYMSDSDMLLGYLRWKETTSIHHFPSNVDAVVNHLYSNSTLIDSLETETRASNGYGSETEAAQAIAAKFPSLGLTDDQLKALVYKGTDGLYGYYPYMVAAFYAQNQLYISENVIGKMTSSASEWDLIFGKNGALKLNEHGVWDLGGMPHLLISKNPLYTTAFDATFD
jgi:hypothetical protein